MIMSVFPEVCPIKGNSELPPWGAVQAQNLLDSHRCFFPDFIRLLFTSNQSPGRPGLSEGLCLHGSMQRCGTCASASAGSVASARPARCRARSRHRQPRSRRRWRRCRRSARVGSSRADSGERRYLSLGERCGRLVREIRLSPTWSRTGRPAHLNSRSRIARAARRTLSHWILVQIERVYRDSNVLMRF